MSTSRSRLNRSIQAIAKQDSDLRRAIEATKPRGDQPSAAGLGTSDAERDRICCDGSISDNPNPGTEERDPSDGGQDASGGLNSDDPADIGDMGSGSLSGLHDCATGEPVCFDGVDWIPPDGWGSPTDPPLNDEFIADSNVFWSVTNQDPSFPHARTKGQLRSVIASFVWDGSEFCGYYLQDSEVALEGCYGYDEAACSTCFGQLLATPQSCSSTVPSTALGQLYCGTDYGNPEEDEIYVTTWPEDGCTNLAIKNGSIVGSKYDPENDGSYSKPMSEIELCDDFGNSFYLSPSAGGGWKTINATKDAGYLWGSNGQKIAHIDGNEYSDPDI